MRAIMTHTLIAPRALSRSSFFRVLRIFFKIFMIYCFWFAVKKTPRTVTVGGEKTKNTHNCQRSGMVEAEDSHLLF